MPAVSLGAVGSGTNTTSGTTLAVTASTNIAAGTLLVLALTFDNHASTTAPTMTLTTGGGGTWSKDTTTYGAGVTTTAGSGIWGVVYTTTTTSAISSGATITTITFSTAIVKKIAQVVGFTGLTATTRVVWSIGALSGVSNSAGTLIAGDVVLGIICGENNATPGADTDTLNGSWSALAGFATTGGAANTNLAVGIQSKIVTAAGTQTYNGTSANDLMTFVGVLVPSASIIQSAYRFYADGTETGSTALAAENTAHAWYAGSDLNLGLRVRMQAYTSFSIGAATDDYVLQYEKNANGVWIPVGNTPIESYETVQAGMFDWLVTGQNKSMGQSFVATGQPIAGASFYIKRIGNPTGTISAILLATTAVPPAYGPPDGTILATSTALAISTVPTTEGWVNFTFPTPYTPTAGQGYVVAVTVSNPQADTNYIGFYYNTASDHIGHRMYQNAGSGTWAGTDSNSLFRVYTTAPTDVVAYDSANLTEGAATTARLTAGTGSFVAGKVAEDGLVDDLQVTASNYTELLYSLTLKAAAASAGTLRFRVLHNNSLTYTGSTVTPSITVTAPNPKVGTLVDDFASALDKGTKWASSSAATVWDASGRAKLPITSSYYVLQTPSAGSYDLTGSSLLARVYPTLGGNGTRECFMEVLRGGTTNDKLTMFASGTDFNVRKTVAGAHTYGPGSTYNATAHAWWKISESGGTIYFHTSPDGVVWTLFWSVSSGFDITNVYINFSAGWYTSDPGGADAFIDNVNVPGTLPKLSTLTETFDTQIDPAKWSSWGGTAWDAGRARVEASANPGYGGAFTVANYDFTESSVFAKVSVPSMVGTTARECIIQVYLDDNNMLMAYADSGGGYALRIRQAGANTDQFVTYNPILHAYWRLRLVGTTVYLDGSPDGATWTNLKSGTTSLTLTAVKLYMLTGQWAAEAAIVPAYFDDINTPAAVAGYPKVETLTDAFTTELNKALVWQSSNTAAVWDSGRAKIPCTTAYPNMGTNFIGTYNLTGSSVFARVTPPPTGSGTRQTMMETVKAGDSLTRLRMGAWAGNLSFWKTIGGTDTQGPSIAYDPVAHAFWRIRESGGTAYFDTSPDSRNWTNRWSVAPGFDITQVAVNFLSGYYGTETASNAYVDYVNVAKGPPTWVGSAGAYQTAGGTMTVTLPAGWQPGDLAILVTGNDAGTDPNYATPAGWTFQKKTVAVNMHSYVWTRVLQDGDTTVGVYNTGSSTTAVGVWRDAALGTIGAFGVRSGTIFTVQSPDIASTGYRAHIFSDRSIASTAGETDVLPTALTYGTNRGFYAGNPTLAASAGICAVFFADSAPGQSGVNTATLIDSSSNAWGLQIELDAGAATTGRPKVWTGSAFVSKPGKVWTGSAWVEKPWKRWTGTEWKALT